MNKPQRPPRHILKKMRQEESKKRAEARAKMTTQEKLDALDKLLGKNTGAKKERTRLQAQLEQEKKEKEADKVVKKKKAEKPKKKTVKNDKKKK